jgi:hypothetical protein
MTGTDHHGKLAGLMSSAPADFPAGYPAITTLWRRHAGLTEKIDHE